MHASDYPSFQAALNGLGLVFGKELPEPLVQAYWDALKDLPLSTVKAFAGVATKHGKYFPKPCELRPREARTPVARTAAMDHAFQEGEARAAARLDLQWRLDHAGWLREVSPKVYAIGRRRGMTHAQIAAKLAAYAPAYLVETP